MSIKNTNNDERDSTQKSIMVVFAHPDDAELGCAGTLAKWIKRGCEVQYVVCTNGNKGTKDRTISPHQLAQTREKEQLAAAEIIGVRNITFLRHQDGELEPSTDFRGEIAMLIRKSCPDIIFTHDPWQLYQIQKDHRTVGMTVVDAIVAARDHLFLPAQTAIGLEPFEIARLFLWSAQKADYFEDITEFIEVKLKALSRHKSQVCIHSNWRERILELAREAGKSPGMSYAEGFKQIIFRQ